MGEGAGEGQGWGGGRDGVGEACWERWGSDGTPLRREELGGTGRNWKEGDERQGGMEEGRGQRRGAWTGDEEWSESHCHRQFHQA